MNKKIADNDGVDIVLPPSHDAAGLEENIVFAFSGGPEEMSRDWDIVMSQKGRKMGRARFSAFQFIADGVTRRTISLRHIEVYTEFRGKGHSYEITRAVVDMVQRECDAAWGAIDSPPVMFVESAQLKAKPHEGGAVARFLRKVGSKVLGLPDDDRPPHDYDISVIVIGEDASMQLIEGHLTRSSPPR